MISINEWIDKAHARIEMALSETVKQLEHEANALWKGKRVCGETFFTPIVPIDGLVSRVAVIFHPDDYADGVYMQVVVYAMVDAKEMTVYDPRFSNETTP